jgi:stress response protein YsnF
VSPNGRPGSISDVDQSSADPQDAVEVVRSEEQLRVGTVVRASGRAVLRRYVVTETVTQTFQVRHEEFRLDHEPLVDGQQPVADGAAFDNQVIEMVLHREVPVVSMRVVATERVRLHVDTVTEQVQVSDRVAQERVDIDVPGQVGDGSGTA